MNNLPNQIGETEIDNINVLANMIFLDNNNNNKIYIECSDFNNNEDLYFFFIELTMNGLRLLFGDPNNNNKVDIEKLQEKDIKLIKEKLYNAAVELNLEIIEHDIHNYKYVNIENMSKKRRIDITQVLYDYPKDKNNHSLEEYKLIIQKLKYSYVISYKIIEFFF